MFEELIGKKVKCSNLDIISFMYPNFLIVDKNDFRSIRSPFIYIGNKCNFPLLKNKNSPYLIITKEGEYDLDNRYVLIELACKKNNINIPKDLYWVELLSWSEFFDIFKLLWVTGILKIESGFNNINFLSKVLENLKYPPVILHYYFKYLEQIDVYQFALDLLNFIHNAKIKNAFSTKVKNNQKMFLRLYKKNVSFACKNLLYSTIENKELRVYNFLSDLFFGEKGVYIYHD